MLFTASGRDKYYKRLKELRRLYIRPARKQSERERERGRKGERESPILVDYDNNFSFFLVNHFYYFVQDLMETQAT